MIILDRYVLKQFFFTLIYSILALYMIFIIVSLMENLDEFLDQGLSPWMIAKYYIYYFPEITKLLTPVSMLLATLFSVGKMANQNEITAMKSSGMSLYRLMLPIVIVGFLLSGWQYYFNGWIVPKAIQKKNDIEKFELKKKENNTTIFNLYFRDTPQKNITLQSYNSDLAYGRRVVIDEFTSNKNPRLKSSIYATSIKWLDDENKWLLENGEKRTFDKKIIFYRFKEEKITLNMNHQRLTKLKKEIDEMNFDELWNNINLLSSGGKDVRKQLIEFYGELAFPFANLIIVLFGVPFASIKKKGGMAVQIAAALIVSFTYLIFTEISKTIAYSYDMNPILAGWLANIIFFLISVVIIIKTKK